ncbi:protein GVQW3-like [Contarinia nasturtii]|uniref:protein GVQW3-like n=1 Tax=Contarinia nasturtii TaxID=265458 RepID=UPI0012D3E156|nr:protein GVQW3-like [Contarinia nasturtii]
MDKIEYRAVIKFLTKESVAPKDINDRLRAVYGERAPSYATVKLWAKQFKLGRESLEDDPRSGRPIEATAPDMVEKIEHLVHENPRMSKKVLAAMFDVSERSIFRILHEKLLMTKVCSRWIPRTLNIAQKEERIAAAREFLELLESNEEDTFERVVTGDELWIHYYDPELKSQTMECVEPVSKVPRKQIATNKA